MDFNHFNSQGNTSDPQYRDGDLPSGDAYNVSFKKCQNALVGAHNHFNANVVNITTPLPDLRIKRPFAITRRGYLAIASLFILFSIILFSIIIYIFVFHPEGTYQSGSNSTNIQQPNVTRSHEVSYDITTEYMQKPVVADVTQSPEVSQDSEVPHEKKKPDAEIEQKTSKPDDQDMKKPAIDWFVTREQWGGSKPHGIKCANNVSSDIIKVDNLKIESCNSKEECVKVIKREYLDSNFLIGNDGRVYENRGWNCLSSYYEDIYDLNHSIKISFIGDYTKKKLTNSEKQLFHLLVQYGIKEAVLREKQYRIYRACEGVDPEIISFLKKESRYHEERCLR